MNSNLSTTESRSLYISKYGRTDLHSLETFTNAPALSDTNVQSDPLFNIRHLINSTESAASSNKSQVRHKDSISLEELVDSSCSRDIDVPFDLEALNIEESINKEDLFFSETFSNSPCSLNTIFPFDLLNVNSSINTSASKSSNPSPVSHQDLVPSGKLTEPSASPDTDVPSNIEPSFWRPYDFITGSAARVVQQLPQLQEQPRQWQQYFQSQIQSQHRILRSTLRPTQNHSFPSVTSTATNSTASSLVLVPSNAPFRRQEKKRSNWSPVNMYSYTSSHLIPSATSPTTNSMDSSLALVLPNSRLEQAKWTNRSSITMHRSTLNHSFPSATSTATYSMASSLSSASDNPFGWQQEGRINPLLVPLDIPTLNHSFPLAARTCTATNFTTRTSVAVSDNTSPSPPHFHQNHSSYFE